MSEYKVTQLSSRAPNVWEGPHGTVYYIRVMLEGHEKPVDIGKKKPDAIKVGDIVSGDIKSDSGAADKFKAAPLQGSFGGGGSSSNSSSGYTRDDDAIKAQFAIKAAIEYVHYSETGKVTLDTVETVAKQLFLMIDRVKRQSQIDTTPDSMDAVHKQNPLSPAITDEFGDGTEYVDLPSDF